MSGGARGWRSNVAEGVVRKVDAALAQVYGDGRWPGSGDPVGGLIGTILSQNTTAANSRAAYASLREAFATWDEVADAPEAQVARAIHSGGLANQKAERIRAILRQTRDERGSINLDFLSEMPVAEALGYLASFTGVGAKTAACVLMFELGKQVFPVDTHVLRICKRLGWIPPDTTADQAHELLADIVPGDIMYRLHVSMVAHGRALCRPRRPGCGRCPIRDECDWECSEG